MDDFFAWISGRWPGGRADYHWHVLPGTELLRERLARPYSELTEQPGLARVRPEYMHITIQHLAPVGDVTESELADIIGRIRDRCASIAPFAVTAARAEAWETSVVCPLRPGYLLSNLWHVVTTVSKTVTGSRFSTHASVFHPHLALAYGTAHLDQDQMRAWLSDCDAAEVPLPVTRLVLVAQKHNAREITFRVLDQVSLMGEQPLHGMSLRD
jgi:2'-5' RNA ligase